ncbi:hypothetical protein QBC32DRAFT_34544 [Pseudoneurospora amorphoporcata]|uniref:Uncharacterized protein n=1 Tax=Pseudoneurospora amorphoporcata TaxID=241081 RepID=A0AAN6P4P4_9PEZI|nr:hypothetical protein QBC32DRAFT_34544 [Pseudoneurospora amorphoporcata]
MFCTIPNALCHGLTQRHLIFCHLNFSLQARELVTFCSNATVVNGTDGNLVDWYSFTEATVADSVENFVWAVQSNTCPTRLLPKLGVEGKPGLGRYWCESSLQATSTRIPGKGLALRALVHLLRISVSQTGICYIYDPSNPHHHISSCICVSRLEEKIQKRLD